MPLALELAAARAKVLSVEQMAERLESSFEILARGSRTALPRHQTLRATIEWSYNSLSDAESALFRRLSVFAGGFTLEAAEAVCGDPSLRSRAGFGLEAEDNPNPKIQNPKSNVLDVLSHLVDKSLVSVSQSAGSWASPNSGNPQSAMEVRYRLLETLRQYGHELLAENGDTHDLAGRHARYYADLCAEAASQLYRPHQVQWLDRLTIDLGNLRAALEWCHDYDPRLGLILAGSILRFWHMRGYLSEGRRWLNSLLALYPERTPVRAKALYTSGYLAARQGDNLEGVRLLEESLSIYTELGDLTGTAWTLEALGVATSLTGDNDLGLIYMQRSVALLREIGDRTGLGWTLGSTGMHARTVGDYSLAHDALNESYALTRETGDLIGIAYALNNLGQLARVRGDYDQAWHFLQECLDLSQEIGNKPFACWSLECMSMVARMRGDWDQAYVTLERSLEFALEMGILRHLARCIYSYAILAVHFGHNLDAVRLFAATLALHPPTKHSLDADEIAEWDEMFGKARAGLSDEDFGRAWAEGAVMTREEAIACARSVASA
jgi:non-specific serine/threonine protein kinase